MGVSSEAMCADEAVEILDGGNRELDPSHSLQLVQ
jgi:hypothetical protein